MKIYLANCLAFTAIVLSFVPQAFSQQEQEEEVAQTTTNTTVTVEYYDGGSAGVDTNDMYYFISAEFHQNFTQSICFVDPVLPPESVDQICGPSDGSGGVEKMSLSQCKDLCRAQGYETLTSCPLNLAGCCECPYFSFKANNLEAGSLYSFEDGIAWTGIPGWFNLGVWIALATSLVFLLVSAGRTSPEMRQSVINGTRALGLLGLLIFAVWILWYLIGLNAIAYQGFYAWGLTAAGLFMHVLFSAIWLVCGIIQYLGPVRRRWPRFHRINGWAFVTSAVLSSIGLIILCLAPHGSSLGGTLITFFFGAYWNFCLFLAIKYAIQRKIDVHRVWMTRHMFLGASVAFQRVFNVADEWLFKDLQYYVGSIYEPACIESQGLLEIQVIREGKDPAIFSPAQTDFLCNGIQHLGSSYSFSIQLIICLFVIGIGGAELWLYACGLRESQKRTEKADVSISINDLLRNTKQKDEKYSYGSINDLQSDMPSDGKLSLHRTVEEMTITLIERSTVAEDTVFVRFKLPNLSDTIVVPLFGHVNLRKQGMARPRPYSPIKAMEPGHISFYIRDVKTKNGLSNHVVEDMEIDDTLFLSGPEAPVPTPVCTKLPNETPNTLVLAAGTGITPFLSFFDVAAGNVRAIVLDRSKDRAIGLDQFQISDQIAIDHIYDRDDYIRHVEDLLVASDGTPWDAVLICGPNAFNLAIQNHVNRILRGKGNSIVFAIGTDDR